MAKQPLEMFEATFFLPGDVPGKKNSKMMTRGRLITDPVIQQQLKLLTMLARNRWRNAAPLTNASVCLMFNVSSKRKDLDNTAASVMDVLKDAGVIVNDSMAHVKRLTAEYRSVGKGFEGVEVSVSGEISAIAGKAA